MTTFLHDSYAQLYVIVSYLYFQQFVWSEFSEEYIPTERRETFYPSVVLADRLYELKITDLPTIPYFPVSSHLEWTDFRYYGLRSATAYVLVFDLSNQDTFQVCTSWNLIFLNCDKLCVNF